MAGRYDYELGNATGLQYGDTFDGAQLSYDNAKMTATAGYGKFKEGDLNDTKTAYGELEGKFGGGSAAGSKVGVFYNNFNKTNLAGSTAPDDLWGTYASVNFGKKFNLLGEYQNVNNPDAQLMQMYSTANFSTVKLRWLSRNRGTCGLTT